MLSRKFKLYGSCETQLDNDKLKISLFVGFGTVQSLNTFFERDDLFLKKMSYIILFLLKIVLFGSFMFVVFKILFVILEI